MTVKANHEAPEGGWGWVIVAAFALNNIFLIPIMQSFGLLFRYSFQDLHFTSTDITTIINVNSAFGFILGVFNGPLFNKFGYRKIAIAGSLITFVGFFWTSFASSFWEFIIFYGLLHSIGFSLTMSSFSLALNTYFNKKRTNASGYCATATGLGPVFMPLLISWLMDVYGANGTALVLTGLSLHGFIGALLLQPVHWHYKKSTDPAEKEGMIEMKVEQKVPEPDRVSLPPYDYERTEPTQQGYDHFMSPRRLSQLSMSSAPKQQAKKPWYVRVAKFLNLRLLKDPIYRNIWIGMSLAFTAEINFSLLTPLILEDKNFGVESTAQIMSTIAGADIVTRLFSPFIGNKTNFTPRYLYMCSLILLMSTRTCFAFITSFEGTMLVGLFLGVAKGFRTVYMTLVIPSHVSLQDLPYAAGLQTVLNGGLLVVFGPIIGVIRDFTGTYVTVIHFVNLLTLTTVVMWSVEKMYDLVKEKPIEDRVEDSD